MIMSVQPLVQERPKEETITTQKRTDPIDFTGFVKEQVLNKLGKPKNLNFIRASNIFENRWRIDVWCHFDSTVTIMPTKCSKIFHSYFAHTGPDGQIIYSNPEIKKEY